MWWDKTITEMSKAEKSETVKSVLLIGGGMMGSALGARLLAMNGLHLTLVESAVQVREGWEAWAESLHAACEIYPDLEALPVGQSFDWVLLAVPESSSAMLLVALSEALDTGRLALGVHGGIIPLNSSMGELYHIANRLGLRDYYVPVHPIAGSEQRGFSPLRLLQVAGAPAVLGASAALSPVISGVQALFLAMGFELTEMTLEDHDAFYASTSHLNHLLAVLQGALHTGIKGVEPPSSAVNRRLAKSDAALWSDLLWHNRRQLLRALEGLEALLSAARQGLCASSPEALEVLWRRCQAGETLPLWREEIDHIDEQVSMLLAERLRWVQRIGGEKRSHHAPIVDPGREAQVLRRVAKGDDPQSQAALASMYQSIMLQCRAVQQHG